MAEKDRFINATQYAQLKKDIGAGDRIGFYLHLYQYSGSENALLMGQVSSGSSVPGGVAWTINLQIQKMFPDLYPKGGVAAFSLQIAQNDLGLITLHESGNYKIPNELLMLEGAQKVWNDNKLKDWFPGNGVIAAYQASEGKWTEASENLARWKAFLPLVGNGAMELAGEVFGSRNNFSKDIQEFLDQNPGATKATITVEGRDVITITGKDGKTLGMFPQSKPLPAGAVPFLPMQNDYQLKDKLAELTIPQIRSLVASVGPLEEGYTASEQALKNAANREALAAQWEDSTAGLTGPLQVLVDSSGSRVTVIGDNGTVTMAIKRNANGSTDYLFSAATGAAGAPPEVTGSVLHQRDADKDGKINGTEHVIRQSDGAMRVEVIGTGSVVNVVGTTIKVTDGAESSTFDFTGTPDGEVALTPSGMLSREIVFDPDGSVSLQLGGQEIFEFSPTGNTFTATATNATLKGSVDGITHTVALTDTGLTSSASLGNGGIAETYTQDAQGNWVPTSWTQEGQTFSGGDLNGFLTRVQSASNAGDSANGQATMTARVNEQLAAASGDNAAGVTTAKDSAASLDNLAARLGMPYVSDRWAPAVLNGQLPAGLRLSGFAGSTFLAGQAGIAQSRINTLQNQPSIFTVTVMGSGFSYPLVLDLDDDGLDLVSLDRSSASFDANASGTPQTVGWVGPREGIPVLDKNGNGTVDNAGEWFGQKFTTSATPPPAGQDGFKALATLAKTGSTTLSAATSLVNAATGKRYFDELKVWVDADQDGKTDAGELRSLANLGITSIDLSPQAVNKPANGNTILSKAGYTSADGKRHTVSDVGLATELGSLAGNGVRPVSAAALAFAEYAGKGYAAMAAGQAKAIAAAVQALPANEAAAIATLQSKFVLPAGTVFSSPAAFEAKAKMRWAVLRGLPANGLNDKIVSYIGPASDLSAIGAAYQRINTAPTDIIDVLNGIGALRSGELGVATAIDDAAAKLSDSQTKAQVANATQTGTTRTNAWIASVNATSAWDSAIVGYLNIKDQIAGMAARLPAIQDKLNALVPQNLKLIGHLPDGGTFLTRNDASIAAEAFRAYAAALQPMAALKVTGDQLLNAIAQSNGYNKVYVGQNGQTTAVENGYNLLVGSYGNQTFTLNAGVDNIAVTSATGSITVNGFQVGDAGDQIQFLAGGFSSGYVTVASDGQGNTILTKGAQTVKLMGVDPSKLDLYANLVGAGGVQFVNTASGVRSLRGESVYDGLQHVTSVAASNAGDTLVGSERGSTLLGGAGNDTFVITGRETTAYGGDGNNTVSYAELGMGVKVGWEERYVRWDDDRPEMEYFYADTLGSHIEGISTIVGTKFNDQISGNGEANVINAGKGNDTLAGGLGGDTYVLALGDGTDSIKESANSVGTAGGSDTLSFAAGIAPAALKATRNGEDLVLSYSANDTVVIGRWFAADPQRIERVTFADGTIWDAAKLTSLVNAPTVQRALAAQNATEDAIWTFVVPVDTFVAKSGSALNFSATLANGAALPSWLRFDAKNRTFTGTPLNADVGNLALAVIATDPAGGYVSTTLAVTIANTNDAPTAGTPAVAQDVAGGVQWTYTLPADMFRDVDVGDKLTYSAALSDGKALPAWLSFNAATRTFSGKAGSSDAGALNLKIIATDLAGASASQPLKITVIVGRTFVGSAANDTLTGTIGNDFLNGLGGNDMMSGGDGNDNLDGGTGADSMNGGAGDDTYLVDSASDIITELAGGGRDTVIASVTVDLTRLGSGQIEDASLTGTANLNLTGNALNNVLKGNVGNNVLYGGRGDDTLVGGGGSDTLLGGEGNDTYVITGQNTIVLGNEGLLTDRDTVSYAEMGAGIKIEWKKTFDWDGDFMRIDAWFSDSAGGHIQGVDNIVGSNFNDQIIGHEFRNVIHGGAGDDWLDGGAGKDTLIGGVGNDMLIGGTDSDTYQFGRGDGADTIQESVMLDGGTDLLSFGPGIEASQLWFSRTSNDLEIGIIGTSDKVTVRSWYSGSQYHVEQIKTSDGKVLLDSQVQNLVQAMAAFSPPAAGQTTLPSTYQTSLAPTLAANWQ